MFLDRIFGRAAELGFYFLFALFPTLFSASSILGLAAQSAHQFYDRLLDYLALVIPTRCATLRQLNIRTICLAAGNQWNGVVDACAVVDAFGSY